MSLHFGPVRTSCPDRSASRFLRYEAYVVLQSTKCFSLCHTANIMSGAQLSSTPRGWFLLEHRYYQRSKAYSTLQWNLTPSILAKAITAIAPNGGPVAIVPDFGWAFTGFVLAIYSLSGRLLKQYQGVRQLTTTPVRVVALGWAQSGDVLTVVYDDGGVVRISLGEINDISELYHVSGDRQSAIRVNDAIVLSSGDVIARDSSGVVYRLATDNSVFTDPSVTVPPLLRSDETDPTNCSSTIVGIARDRSSFGDIESLILGEGGSLFKVNSAGANKFDFKEPISQISISENCEFFAFIIASTSTLVVSSVDFSKIIARVNLGVKLADRISDSNKEPKRIKWVGSDAVAVFYENEVVLVGPQGIVVVLDIENESTSEQLLLSTEVDGLRMLSASSLEFIHLVPTSVVSVFCEKSHPGFKLLRGSGAPILDFQVSPEHGRCVDPLSRYELIAELRDSENLRAAARSCAETALLVDNPAEQKALLRATAYGLRFNSVLHKTNENAEDESDDLHGHQPSNTSAKITAKQVKKHNRRKLRDEDLVPTAVTSLRIINAVRADSIGIALTKKQFDRLGLAGLVSRLSQFGEHSLAMKLAAYGDISPTRVLERWAVAVISKNVDLSEAELTTRIIERFETVEKHVLQESSGNTRGRALPYVRAAEAAFALNKTKCADFLLRKEHRPAPKVAMYLRMEREAQAVIAAVASSDPELVLDVLGKVRRRKTARDTARDTARLLRSLPPAIGNRAIDLLADHLRQLEEFDAMRIIYLETGRVREAALVDISHVNGLTNDGQRAQLLEKIARNIRRGRHGNTCQFEVQSAQHAADVAKSAKEIEKKAGLEAGTLSRSNDSELLRHAIRDIKDSVKRREMVSALRRDLRIPDRRFFWVCLDAMAEAGDFQSIEALSHSAGHGRPPPIGLMAFVDACLRYKQEEEAKKYAERISDLRSKARALARCGYGKEATDLADRLRNPQLQEEIAELVSLHANAL